MDILKNIIFLLLFITFPVWIVAIPRAIASVISPKYGKIDHKLVESDVGRISKKEHQRRLRRGYYHYDSGRYRKLM